MTSPSLPTVLVTGGAGYIGSHTCKALAAAGFRPVVYDNLSTGHRSLVRFGPLIEGDIRDITTLSAVIAQERPVAVLHFAALLAVGESVTHPADYYGNNVHGTWCLLDAMRRNGVNTLIFSSTAAVYGTPPAGQESAITEDAPTDPINPYGNSKLAVEMMLADYRQAYSLRYAALRYFNAAGADPAGELGSLNPKPTNLLPVAVNVLADAVNGNAASTPLQIFGTDYPTADGTCVRDYIHVADLAAAHVKALQYLLAETEQRHPSGSFNLGTSRGSTVKDIITALEEGASQSLPVAYGPRRVGDPAILVADAARAMAAFNWQPQLSDLPTIVNTAWAWRRKQALKS